MTRKDYVAIAQVIRHEVDLSSNYEPEPMMRQGKLAVLRTLAHEMAVMLATDNPRFDRSRFLTACGF